MSRTPEGRGRGDHPRAEAATSVVHDGRRSFFSENATALADFTAPIATDEEYHR